MTHIDIINHHRIIRETIGYDELSKMNTDEIASIMPFLQIVSNYKKLKRIKDNINGKSEET